MQIIILADICKAQLERLNLLEINDVCLTVVVAANLFHAMAKFDANHITLLRRKLIHCIAKESANKLIWMHRIQNTLYHYFARFPRLAGLLASASLNGEKLDYLKLFQFHFLFSFLL